MEKLLSGRSGTAIKVKSSDQEVEGCGGPFCQGAGPLSMGGCIEDTAVAKMGMHVEDESHKHICEKGGRWMKKKEPRV